jgi:hypothetical protein
MLSVNAKSVTVLPKKTVSRPSRSVISMTAVYNTRLVLVSMVIAETATPAIIGNRIVPVGSIMTSLTAHAI